MAKRTKIHLAHNLAFSTDIITEVIDLIAKRGSGKTYTATKLAEEMLAVGAQVVVVDPVGNWYGLRLGAAGKPEGGMDIKILGGSNGDIPLEHTAGALLAKTIVETGMSVILDLSHLSKVKQRRFVTEFSEALLEYRKRDPGAMHVFWEEAYRFMPQKMAKGSKNEMLEATEELITMGRNFGIGGTVICQRAAIVSKTVLSQASVLISMHINSPGDKKVIMDWMDAKEVSDDGVLVNLSQLKKGEAYVWWPEEFGVISIKVDKKLTYNASATPKFGETTRKKKLKAIDLDALTVAMADTIEKVKSNDPVHLKRRIKELEQQLMLKDVPVETLVERVEVPVLLDADIKRFEAAVEALSTVSQGVLAAIRVEGLVNRAASHPTSESPRDKFKRTGVHTHKSKAPYNPPTKLPSSSTSDPDKVVQLNKGALRMLKALAAVSPGGLTKKQVALQAKLKSSSGTFGTYWSTINVAGFIQNDSSGKHFITTEGMEYLGDDIPTQPDSPEERVDFWCERLSGKAKEMLRHLFSEPDAYFTKEELGEAVGLSHTSGTFGTYLSSLTSNNLAVRENRFYTISPDLMV